MTNQAHKESTKREIRNEVNRFKKPICDFASEERLLEAASTVVERRNEGSIWLGFHLIYNGRLIRTNGTPLLQSRDLANRYHDRPVSPCCCFNLSASGP